VRRSQLLALALTFIRCKCSFPDRSAKNHFCSDFCRVGVRRDGDSAPDLRAESPWSLDTSHISWELATHAGRLDGHMKRGEDAEHA